MIWVFLVGVAYEFLATVWAQAIAARRASLAGLCASGCAVCTVTGVGASLASRPAAVAFVLGYGVGSFLAVRLRRA